MPLEIRTKECLYIFSIGIFFSMTLCLLCYSLLQNNLFHGVVFRFILGNCLSSSAIIFTFVLNRYFLPLLPSPHWVYWAGFFLFLSGLCGTLIAYFLSYFLHVKMLMLFAQHFVWFGFFIGMMSCVVALLLYQFITLSHAKEKQEKLLIQSRLKSLERQLNPHFLFNALNSLAELLHVNPFKAEKILLELSSFLRSSMKEEAMISLSEEMENVIRYIALENVRFDDKIVLICDIPSLLEKKKIPKFSIQLIIENAIKHGFKGDTLTIIISIEQKEKLEIAISNDGLPISKPSFGIGLQNLQERLSLLCDGQLQLKNEHNPIFILSIGDTP
ncbi:MAG: histidine kinase [Sulfurospirillaceae bacterium]|nr:histidine kinase [Sulfurospirillaceae bacterium]